MKNTVLHLASKANKIDLVKLLLFYGIDPNIVNSDNKIALNYAVINNNMLIFKILLYKNSNYKYLKNENNYIDFIETIECYKQKISRKLINTKKKKQSIKNKQYIQSRHMFLCNEISKKLNIIDNDTELINYTTELFNIAEGLNIDTSDILYELNIKQSKNENLLKIYNELCKKMFNKILVKRLLLNL